MTRPRRYRLPKVTVRALKPFRLGRTVAWLGDVVEVSAARAVKLRLGHLAERTDDDDAGDAARAELRLGPRFCVAER